MYIFDVGGRRYAYSAIDNKITNLAEGIWQDTDERLHTQYAAHGDYDFSKMSMFTIEVTQQCNLRCRYCCYSGSYENRRAHRNLFMSNETMTECVKFIKQHADHNAEQITVCFYGGEALLAKEQIRSIIGLLRKEMPHTDFLFSISTNGVLLNESAADWICSDKDIIATVTIDGDRETHDKNRVMPTGRGSFNDIMRNLWSFKKRHSELFNKKIQFISTLKRPSEIIGLNDFWMSDELLHANRPQHISMVIPNRRNGEALSFNRQEYAQVLDKALDSIRLGRENILTDELHRLISRVEHRAGGALPQAQRFLSCVNEPYSCFITTDGNLYVCERFCTGLDIGSLHEGIDIGKCRSIYNDFLDLKRQHCPSCWAQRLCRRCALCLNDIEGFHGQCNAERERIGLALKYYCKFLITVR